jgi:arylsulfatase A-like enzyme
MSPITRREFISQVAGALIGSTLLGGIGKAVLAETKPRKPNVVYVFADQMRNCSLGCMGNKDVKTPNMDKLAGQGTLFTDVVTNFPLCSPHRAILITGRFPLANGVVTNDVQLKDTEITIAKVLKEQGYKTGYIGKWHLDGPHKRTLDEPRLGFDYFQERQGTDMENVTQTDYLPDSQADRAINFIKKNKDEPFCLFLSWLPPHPPYIPPKRYKGKYDPKKLKLRPNVQNVVGKDFPHDISISYAMITGLDDNIGKLMKALDDLCIAEDTIFCFSSDHGDMLGSQGRMNKNLPWEESANIPFIMRYPRKLNAGKKSNMLLSTVDVMPTLLGFCGAPIPKGVEGKDLSSQILGKGGKEPESQYILDVIPGPTGVNTGVNTWRAVRTKQYMYAKSQGKGWLLYDRKKDPYEMDNLIDKPEAKEVQSKMDAMLQEWLTKTGDKFESMEVWWQRIGRKGDPLKAGKASKQMKALKKKNKRAANKTQEVTSE